ncbi:MAG: thiamine S protein [Methanomicrobiaceae archaeon]|nr:thiamine S protein [Methanomicrobiaceae archaeon]
MKCRCIFPREGEVRVYEGAPGDTYADALLAFGMVPDTVLIRAGGRFLPEDAKIEEEEVVVITTCSRG